MSDFKCKEVPNEFPFPFPPYSIQLDFMKAIYQALNEGRLGIFESPTGTGKSLSMICGSVKWLKDYNETRKSEFANQISLLQSEKDSYANETQDWFSAQSKEIEVTTRLNQIKLQEQQLLKYEERIEKMLRNAKRVRFNYNKSNTEKLEQDENEIVEDDDILLQEAEDYEKVDENEEEDEENPNTFRPNQIIIASRTHSQLSQLVGEIKKSPWHDSVRVASLASRQNYCINPNVKRLQNQVLINEKCLDMQKNAKKSAGDQAKKKSKTSTCVCPYYKQTNIENLSSIALKQVMDIEDLVKAGKQLNACPYYASRMAAEDAEIVLVPYNTLLHKSTREACGLKVKDNVVIVDEAHNLLEALAQMYSAEISYAQLHYSVEYLRCYKQRYNIQFSAITLRLLNQLIFVSKRLLEMLSTDVKETITDISGIANFVITAKVDQFNFFELLKFCRNSKIAQKLRSYSMKYPSIEIPKVKPTGIKGFLSTMNTNPPTVETTVEVDKKPEIPIPTNPILALITFLESLTYSNDDGRILVTRSTDKLQSKLQFLLLNPSSNFSDIIHEAKSVIVAGGTMKPIEEFQNRLFKSAGADEARIMEFSCGHIIPKENILPIVVTNGLDNEKLTFNYNNRMLMGKPLKDILKMACDSVRGGIVVFFPSYKYENWVYEQIKSVNFGRVLFREPKQSSEVDGVLDKYATTIKKSPNGALMLSVVGGKLSEGLNFSDDLGRCVIVVGLPYANVTAPDLKEKMLFLDRKEGSGAGRKFYENLCMKAVNQCIGRAVRHKDDYATVLLLDDRYQRGSTINAFPNWIKRSLKICEAPEALDQITKFFKEKTQ